MPAQERKPLGFYLIAVLAGLVLLTPLLTSKALGGSVLMKASVFQWLTLVMAAVWAVLAAGNAKYRPNWRNPLVIAAMSWLAILLLTLPFSLNPSLSFWSSRDRMSGILNVSHWILWFLVLSSTLKTWKEWRVFLAGSNFACLLVGAIGLLELTVNRAPGYRIESTLGNAIYLSYYVLPHVFIALMLAARSSRWPSRAMYLVSFLIHAVVIVETATRGALLAMLFGLVAMAIGYLLLIAKNRRRAVLAGFSLIAVGLVAAGLIGLVRFTEPGKEWGKAHFPQPIQRILYHDFGSDRLSLWRMGLTGWKERPILGRGLENYANILDRHIDSTKDSALSQNWYDRTHNQFIDILIGTGAVGFLAYLFLWAMALYRPLRELRRTNSAGEKAVFLLSAAAVAAQMFALFFAFDTPNASIVFWMVLAMTVGLSDRRFAPEPEPETRLPRQDRRRSVRGGNPPSDLPAIVFTASVALILGWTLNWRPYDQAVDYNRIMAGYHRYPDQTVEALRKRLAKPTFVIHDINFNMMSRLKNYSESQQVDRDAFRDLVVFGTEQMDLTLANRPDNFKSLLASAYAYRELGTYDPNALVRARELGLESIKIAPNRPEGYEELSEIEMLKGNLELAWDYMEQALSVSRHAYTDGRVLMRRSAIRAMQGDMDAAEAELQKALDVGYGIGQDLRNMSDYPDLMKPGEPRPIITRYYSDITQYYPKSTLAKAAFAIAAIKTGNLDLASRQLEELWKLDPNAAESIAKDLGIALR
ncbi:O-antigen ligase family protein [Candidatus Uhrbacteria bacterium]|nr:O-antigen ligase family protein [Candidatus Uhrbacteria bacterium]